MKFRGHGFTLVEVMTSIAIAMVLGLVAFGISSQLRESAGEAQCVSNLRQWGVALNLHMTDHDGRIPRRGQGEQPVSDVNRPEDWFNCLPQYLGLPPYSEQFAAGTAAKPGDTHVFICPTAKRLAGVQSRHFFCYAMNMNLSPRNRPLPHRLAELEDVSRLAFMADAPGAWASTVPSRAGYSVLARHSGKANVVFVDGHIQSFSGAYLGCGSGEITRTDIRWQPILPTPAP